MLDDMWETVNDYNAHAKADNCILFIKDIHFSIFCHETITGLRLLAPTVPLNMFYPSLYMVMEIFVDTWGPRKPRSLHRKLCIF